MQIDAEASTHWDRPDADTVLFFCLLCKQYKQQ